MQIPFSGLLMKEVPPEGDEFNGVFLPAGTRIAHNTLAIQRSTAVFGYDAEIFRPERWLDIAPEKYREMTQVVEMVFGHGRWSCIGKPVAFVELNKVFVQVSTYISTWFQIFIVKLKEVTMHWANGLTTSYFEISIFN